MTREEKLAKQAANLLYCFVPEDQMTRANFGKYLPYIKEKRKSQLAYIRGLATAWVVPREYLLNDLCVKHLEEVYGMDPLHMLARLANRGTVAGLNWEAGIYGCGVGKTDPSSFGNLNLGNGINSSDYKLDPQTGVLTKQSTGQTFTGTPTYGSKGLQSVSYYDEAEGVTLQANYKKGEYSAYSCAFGDNIVSVTGKSLTQSDGNIWENINNTLGLIKDLFNAFAKELSGYTSNVLSPTQVADGWMVEEKDNSGLITAGLIGGAVLLGTTIIGADKGKKQK